LHLTVLLIKLPGENTKAHPTLVINESIPLAATNRPVDFGGRHLFWLGPSAPSRDHNLAARAQGVFLHAREQEQKNPANDEMAWEFGRAAFDWADFATNDTQRATIAIEAISICRQLVEPLTETARRSLLSGH